MEQDKANLQDKARLKIKARALGSPKTWRAVPNQYEIETD